MRQRQCRLDRLSRRFQLRQQHLRRSNQRTLIVDEGRAQYGVGAGTDHDGIAAVPVDIDATSAGRFIARLGDQRKTILRGQRPRQRTPGIVAQRAQKMRLGASTCSRNCLIEALAAWAGAVAPGDGGTWQWQCIAAPHVIDIEGPDNDDRTHKYPCLE